MLKCSLFLFLLLFALGRVWFQGTALFAAAASPRLRVSSTVIHFIHFFLPHLFFFLPAVHSLTIEHTLQLWQRLRKYSSSTDTSHCEHPQVRSARAFLSRDSTSRYSFQRTTLYRIVTTWCAENSLEPFRRLCIKTN